VLRFFHLFVGEQSLAESLAIDTIAEHICAFGEKQNCVQLLRRTVAKGIGVAVVSNRAPDPLVRAVTALEPSRRAVVVLFCGLSLDLGTVARITGLSEKQVSGKFAVALVELQRRVFPCRADHTPLQKEP